MVRRPRERPSNHEEPGRKYGAFRAHQPFVVRGTPVGCTL